MWLRGIGGAGNFDITEDADVDMSSRGVIGGFDHRVRDFVVGAVGSYSDHDLDQDLPISDTEIASWRIGGYGRWQPSQYHFDAVMSYGEDRLDTARVLALGLLTRTARGDFEGETLHAYVEAGYTIDRLLPDVEPFLGLQWASQQLDAHSEAGAGALNLVVPQTTTDSVRTLAGARLRFGHDAHRGAINTEIRAAWSHEFGDGGGGSARLAGDPLGTIFAIRGADAPRDSALIGAGVAYEKSRRWRFFADFDAEVNAAQEVFSVSAGLRYSW
ncbi:MAG: autotransporter outer membrane beta-barrel domain-containing protein [Gammaproteobacteria bacterium]